jgi:hypothetical protein
MIRKRFGPWERGVLKRGEVAKLLKGLVACMLAAESTNGGSPSIGVPRWAASHFTLIRESRDV